jgi:hypothetical protein
MLYEDKQRKILKLGHSVKSSEQWRCYSVRQTTAAYCGIPLHAPLRCVNRPKALIMTESSHMSLPTQCLGDWREGRIGKVRWTGNETAGGKCDAVGPRDCFP